MRTIGPTWSAALVALLSLGLTLPLARAEDVAAKAEDTRDAGLSAERQATPEDDESEAQSWVIPPCPGNVFREFSRRRLPSPGGRTDRYLVPHPVMLGAIATSIESLLVGDLEYAVDDALRAGYLLCQGEGEQQELFLWRPALHGTGGALWIYRNTPTARPLIVEASHPLYDLGTLKQAVEMFDLLQARVLIVSGTHRCANNRPSRCRGITEVCGEVGPYRESDMAHSDNSLFQLAHEVFSTGFDEDLVLSLHGKTYPGIRLSDGSIARTGTTSIVAQLKEALLEYFPGQRIVTCNEWKDRPPNRSLCGVSNVQGRSINGLPACTSTSTITTQRFIHLEQSRWIRKRSILVSQALDRILPR